MFPLFSLGFSIQKNASKTVRTKQQIRKSESQFDGIRLPQHVATLFCATSFLGWGYRKHQGRCRAAKVVEAMKTGLPGIDGGLNTTAEYATFPVYIPMNS